MKNVNNVQQLNALSLPKMLSLTTTDQNIYNDSPL